MYKVPLSCSELLLLLYLQIRVLYNSIVGQWSDEISVGKRFFIKSNVKSACAFLWYSLMQDAISNR